MTFEEMQSVIQGMLAVQQELQRSQVDLKAEIGDLKDSTNDLRKSAQALLDLSLRHERRIEQLLGYSITGDSDRLDLTQRLENLERKVNRLFPER